MIRLIEQRSNGNFDALPIENGVVMPLPTPPAIRSVEVSVTPTAFGTQQHWELRALEARAMADRIDGNDAKLAMLSIAENYDKIAKRAEAKEARVPMPRRLAVGA